MDGDQEDLSQPGTSEQTRDTNNQGQHGSPHGAIVETPFVSSPGISEDETRPTKRHNTSDDVSFSQDGFVSAQCWFMVLLALDVSIVLARWSTADQDKAVEPIHLWLIYIVQQLVSIILMFIVLFNRKRFLIVPDVNDPSRFTVSPALWKSMLRDNIEITCMIVFLAIGLFRELLTIYGETNCMGVYQICGTHMPFQVRIFYRATRLIFFFVEFGFCILVHKRQFRRTWQTSYCLFTIAATTLCFWFEFLINQSKGIFECGEFQYYQDCKNATYGNTTKASECIHHSNDLFQLQHTVFIYLFTVIYIAHFP